MFNWILVFLAACVIPVQAIVNGRLGLLLKNPFLAALTSFGTGTVALLVVALIHSRGIPKIPAGVHIPWFVLTGGLMGCVYVTVILHCVPKLGPANVLTIGIMGQLLTGLVLDQFGLLGMPVHPISLTRIGGVALLVLAAWMIQNG